MFMWQSYEMWTYIGTPNDRLYSEKCINDCRRYTYQMKHTACGHIDNVPVWIIGELAEEDRMSGKHGEVDIECPVCNGPMRRIK